MMNDVPRRRTAPTDGISPSRTRHSAAWRAASRVNSGGSSSGSAGTQARRTPRGTPRALVLVGALVLDEQGRGRRSGSRADLGRHPGLALDRAQRGAVHQLERPRPDSRKGTIAAQAARHVGEEQQARVLERRIGHRVAARPRR